MKKEDPDQVWKTLILKTFKQHEGRYGYRCIRTTLKRQEHKINHKKAQRIMSELHLNCVKFVRKSSYKSYNGEELISYETLQKKIEKYIDYYNNDRIKQKLAGMSPVKYRTQASQLAA